ncbi:YMGG-like glycine zipper-containing protein [Dechloromonas sp. H13]|uniref:YMGG-like glycine zipper-containing protein n=1 Tax=Dechloromonas sp. H13 TaxID=2570193 RepID=UPI001290A91A|nr:YMGG-like glycine zipper-containing protein [Dechloromonas sp. H13]
MKKSAIVFALFAALAAGGCTNMSTQQQGMVSGGAIGAVAGAGIASITGGNAWTGAAIGAAAGTTAGYIRANRQQ